MKLITLLKLASGVLISLAVVLLFSNKSLEKAELALYDWRLKNSYIPASKEIPVPFVIIGSTENFESLVGEPLSRKFYTRIINILEKEGVSVIGLDIFFPKMTGSAEDRDFITTMARSGKVVLPVFSPTKITKRKGTFYLAPAIGGSSEEFNRGAYSLGHINTLPDEDQVIRKVPAFIMYGDTVYPQISLEIARIHKKQQKSSIPPYQRANLFTSHIPVRKDGSIYIKFLPPDEMAKYFIPFEDVILGRFPEGFFKNKTVIIGQTSLGGKNADLVPTPWGTQFGAILQGGILQNFLSDGYIYRTDDRAVSTAVLLLGAVLGFSAFTCGILVNACLLAGLAAISVFFSIYAMKYAGLFIDILPFSLLFFFLYFASLIYSLVNAVIKLFRKETAIRIMQDVEKEITSIINPAELPGITGDFISSGFEGTDVIEQTPEIAMRTLFASLGIEAGAFLLLHIPKKHQIIAQQGRLILKIDMKKITQKALATNQPLIFNRIPRKNEWGVENIKNLMILPLFAQPTFRIAGLFINKYPTPFSKSPSFSRDDIPVIQTLSMQSLIAIQNARLNLALKDTQMESIFRLSVAIEYRDRETGMHIHRVSEYSGLVAENIGLQKNEVNLIKSAMPLHDIGKIAIPDHILLKQGKLTPEERKIVEQHPLIGAKMLEASNSLLLKVSEIIALYHHEKYNGSGYPFHLKGTGIPLYGRIAAIADIFDAMSSKRIYKEAVSIQESFAFLQEESGIIFDPRMTEGFVKQEYEIKKIRETYKDAF